LSVFHIFDKIQGMGDIIDIKPDHACLFAIAAGQRGYFTAAQARACGFPWDALTYHTHHGRYIRIRRGLYRLRDYPSSPREEVIAAWLAVGKDVAVVSHESALDLLGLGDVIPDAVHLTVPRTRRHLPHLPGVTIHTTTRPLRLADIAVRDGVRLTAAARAIVDAAETGTAPEQIEKAAIQAVERGLATPQQLIEHATQRGRRVARLIAGALATVRR
jgi:predicted transcriptional regulator of viral defense system